MRVCPRAGQGGLLSGCKLSEVPAQPLFSPCLSLSPVASSAPSFCSRLPPQTPSPRPWPLSAVPHHTGQCPLRSWGVTVGLGGAEVGGRGPQRRRPALHVLVPLGRVHLRRPRKDRRLGGRRAVAGSRLACAGKECGRGGGGRLTGGGRGGGAHPAQPCALGGRFAVADSGSLGAPPGTLSDTNPVPKPRTV